MRSVLNIQYPKFGKVHSFARFLTVARGQTSGFTLIETLIAISLLMITIVVPMSLTTKSLAAAYYARDRVAAFHLAQEAIDTIRHRRDSDILAGSANILDSITIIGTPFTVNTVDDSIVPCTSGTCPPLQIRSEPPDIYLYEYGSCDWGAGTCTDGGNWTNTVFTRTVTAETVREEGGVPQEIRITADVSWKTGTFQIQHVVISENLYRWIDYNQPTP